MVKPWETTTIGDFLDFKNGLNKEKEFFGYGTPIVNYTDVYKNRGLRKADIRGKVCLTPDEIHRFDVRKNDVFFTRTSETPDEVGMSSVLLEDIENGVFSGFVLRGRPKNDMFVPEYCKYCFSTEAVRNAIITGCTYTTRALTNGKQLSAIELPIPSKPEQEAIAEALSDIDTLIVNLEKLIAKKKAIKQGAMQELLTGKRRLPGFDGEWNTMKVEEIVARFATGLNPRQNFKLNTGGTNYYVTIKDFRDGVLYLDDNCDRIDDLALVRINERSDLRKGDLLFSSIGRIGDAYLITETPTNWNINESVFALRPNIKVIDPLMLYWLLTSEETKRKLVESTTGSTLKSIKLGHLKEIECTFPADIVEQKAISTILYDMDAEIRELEKKVEKARLIKQGMMSELLTGRIRLIDKEDA